MKRLLITLSLLTPLFAVEADCEKRNSCNYSSMWSGFSHLRVKYADSKTDDGATYEYYVSGKRYLMTSKSKNASLKHHTIRGVAQLWQGVGTTGVKSHDECRKAVNDQYAILQSYAAQALFFLGYSVKGGPEKVDDTFIIDMSSDEDTRVQIAKGNYMVITGPWFLKGYVKKAKHINFEITQQSMKEKKPVNLYLSGEWTKAPQVMPVKDSESLDDWLVCMPGRYGYEGEKWVFTPKAAELEKLKTIGDLRALAKK